jgi:hypothetical protein
LTDAELGRNKGPNSNSDVDPRTAISLSGKRKYCMTRPLMPKATAVWLVDNTALTFDQISAFCELHILEVQAIADAEVAVGMQGLDPIRGGELGLEEIRRCEADSSAHLKRTKAATDHAKQQKKKGRYTPVSKRQDRPDAISWLLKNYPELTDAQIGKLVGTTKPTINSVRDRSHWKTSNITAQNPVSLGLCSNAELEKAIVLARARAGTVSAPADENRGQPVAAPPIAAAPGAQPVSMPPAPTEPSHDERGAADDLEDQNKSG